MSVAEMINQDRVPVPEGLQSIDELERTFLSDIVGYVQSLPMEEQDIVLKLLGQTLKKYDADVERLHVSLFKSVMGM